MQIKCNKVYFLVFALRIGQKLKQKLFPVNKISMDKKRTFKENRDLKKDLGRNCKKKIKPYSPSFT